MYISDGSMTSVVTKMLGYAKFLQINIPDGNFCIFEQNPTNIQSCKRLLCIRSLTSFNNNSLICNCVLGKTWWPTYDHMNTYLSTRFFTYVKCYMIISGIPSFALSFVNSFPWFQVATNVMILVLSSEYTTMGPNTFEIEYFVHVQFNKLKLSKNLWIEISVS